MTRAPTLAGRAGGLNFAVSNTLPSPDPSPSLAHSPAFFVTVSKSFGVSGPGLSNSFCPAFLWLSPGIIFTLRECLRHTITCCHSQTHQHIDTLLHAFKKQAHTYAGLPSYTQTPSDPYRYTSSHKHRSGLIQKTRPLQTPMCTYSR